MLAVKFYSAMPSDDENVLKGISGKIPAEVIFNVDTAPDNNYILMSDIDYQAYSDSISSELEQWRLIQKQEELQ